jgi:hypothetical protein
MKKRNLIFTSVLVSALLLCSCGNSDSDNVTNEAEEASTEYESVTNETEENVNMTEDSSSDGYQIGETVVDGEQDSEGDYDAISAYLGEYQGYDDESMQLGLYLNDYYELHVICSVAGGETYYEQIYYDYGVVDGTLYAKPMGAYEDEYVLTDSGMLDVLLSGYGSTHYQTYTKIGDSSNDSDDESWNLGEFSEDWYKSAPNFADTDGNTLEIIYLDDGELEFAINGETMYYGMANEHTDYGDGIYIYTLNDGSGNEATMLYYPKDTIQIDSMVFTAVQ